MTGCFNDINLIFHCSNSSSSFPATFDGLDQSFHQSMRLKGGPSWDYIQLSLFINTKLVMRACDRNVLPGMCYNMYI